MSTVIEQNYDIYSLINNTKEDYPAEDTIITRFSKVVTENADREALSFGSVSLTYAELAAKSAQVANTLTTQGLVKGDFIGIYMERSIETVISIVGILRMGGVYVPIDPEHPVERNRHIFENSNCKQLLIKDQYSELATSSFGVVNPISIERCFSSDAGISFSDVITSPDDLAYVIYTSGSTGRPKGVLLAHRGVINLWNTITKLLDFSNQDVTTQFSTFSFDASVFDTFLGLLNGAHLVLLTKEEQLSPELLLDLLEKKRVTHIGSLPTSVFNRLSEVTFPGAKSKLSTVRTIVVAGEALLSERVVKFQDKFGTDVAVMNGYGPTECTVATTLYKVSDHWISERTTVPIGKPIGNYKVYVVKDDGQLADVGELGELYIETPGLAKGYLNLPDKTAEVFVKNPFSSDPNSQIYKSGDIVKILEDGNLEFHYRKDGQLKLRGFRIEIDEIENVLNKHESIADAAVVAIKENGVVKHLSCFYSEKENVSVADLKSHLKNFVPHYMVPSYFYLIPEIPLAPTGKVDRNKLHGMDNPELAKQNESFEEPVGSLETLVASIWSEILGITRIGRNESFFDIGGDSLAVITVLSNLKLDFVNLRINDLYEHKTVKGLAEFIATLTASAEGGGETIITNYKDLNELPALPKIEISGRDGLGSDILLTGVTGYLGSHLFYDLLTTTDANIYVLIRPKFGENGISRLWKTLDSYFGTHFFAEHTKRIFVLEGDLSSDNLGLSDNDLNTVRTNVTSIIHAGADVRHFGNTEAFHMTNVVGTGNLLKFVYEDPSITFHFVSTLGIAEDLAAMGLWESVSTNIAEFYNVKLDSVYTNSKLLSEKLVAEAIAEGLPCSIYRAGNLSCHSVTGHFQNNINENSFYRMLKSFILLAKAPSVDTYVDVTPVDFASSFMLALMKRSTLGEVYHICNPSQEPYEALISFLQSKRYKIDLLSQKDFDKWVLREGNSVNKEGVQLAMTLLDGDGLKTNPYRFSCNQSFQKSGIASPVPYLDLLDKLITHAIARDYFPKPVTDDVQFSS